MPSALAAVAGQIQDIRAQALSTLMATLGPVAGAARVTGTLAGNPEAAMQSADAALHAVIVEANPNGRAVLQVNGGRVETQLPPELLRAARQNPDLLKPGTTLLLSAETPTRPLPEPATLVALTGHASGPSVGPAPPLANPFPPGSLGAAIARLTGIAFPQAEAEALPAAQAGELLAQTKTGISTPGLLSQSLPADLAEAVLQSARRQVPLAPALTQILTLVEALPGQSTPANLPPALVQALRALQGARATPEGLKTPEGLREAIRQSGLFLEANLAREASGGTPATGDLKTILLALKSLLGRETAQEPGAHALATAAPSTPARSQTPASGTAGSTTADLARTVEGAVERVKLMQMASLPDHPEIRITDDRAQPMRLALAIPIATQGHENAPTAVMGLMIEHRPPMSEAAPQETELPEKSEAEAFPWKVRIALDLEETGPVQAEIALRGQSVAVTLWAERPAIADRARSEIGALHAALTGAAFDVFKLDVKDGRPQGKPMRAAPMLDRRT
jgi:Flagellar hook-length control protein FliK